MKNLILIKIYHLYRMLFAKKAFYGFNKFLYNLSLRGLGVLNFESDKVSGEASFIKLQVSQIAKGVILDVGANVGHYSLAARAANQTAEIFAFEPHPLTFQQLIKNTDKLEIKAINAGVGRTQGVLSLYDYADNDGSSHASLYKAVIEEIHKGQSIAHEVKVITLDEFVVEHKIESVGLLKIDTEGHELEVLRGFHNFITAGKVDMIHFEFNEMNIASKVWFKDFWDFLPNYDFYRMLPDGMVPIKNYSPLMCEIFAYQNIVAKLKSAAQAG